MTVSGFVVHEGRVALYLHPKLRKWLPAGGHIEPGESPQEAVLREVREEFGLEAGLLRLAPRVKYEGGPRQTEPPYTVLEYWLAPDHGHIDYVYFLRCRAGYPGISHAPESPVCWLSTETLAAGHAEHNGERLPFPPDIQALGIEAIRLAAIREDISVATRRN